MNSHRAMDKAKSLAKGGWHPPGKDGGRESWRGDNKGINQVVCRLPADIIAYENERADQIISRPVG